MFIVHHLNNSRSQRILWLLEELELNYDLRRYERDAVTNLAPSELASVHPLGKAPVLEHNGRRIAESGASSDGFRTTVQPAASAGATFSTTWFIGQFHGVIRAATPIG